MHDSSAATSKMSRDQYATFKKRRCAGLMAALERALIMLGQLSALDVHKPSRHFFALFPTGKATLSKGACLLRARKLLSWPPTVLFRGSVYSDHTAAEVAAFCCRYTGSPSGCIYGPANIPSQAPMCRYPPMTAIPSLFIGGQWALVGAGMTGVMVTARLLSAELERQQLAWEPSEKALRISNDVSTTESIEAAAGIGHA